MAGRVYHARDYEEGVTAPPFHPNCGCEVRAYWGEREEAWEEGDPPPKVPSSCELGLSYLLRPETANPQLYN